VANDFDVIVVGGECVGVAQFGKYKTEQQTPVNGLFIVGCDVGSSGMATHQASTPGIIGAKKQFNTLRNAS